MTSLAVGTEEWNSRAFLGGSPDISNNLLILTRLLPSSGDCDNNSPEPLPKPGLRLELFNYAYFSSPALIISLFQPIAQVYTQCF
jgi:hypothetical protein